MLSLRTSSRRRSADETMSRRIVPHPSIISLCCLAVACNELSGLNDLEVNECVLNETRACRGPSGCTGTQRCGTNGWNSLCSCSSAARGGAPSTAADDDGDNPPLDVAGAGGSGGGSAGSGGAAVEATCSGCVVLTVPIPATPVDPVYGSQATYVFQSVASAPPFDLDGVSRITWRIRRLSGGPSYVVRPFLQMGPPEDLEFVGAYADVTRLSDGAFRAGAWVDVVLQVAAIPVSSGDAGLAEGTFEDIAVQAGFDKSRVRGVGFAVGALPTALAGTASVELDAVIVDGVGNFATKVFVTSLEGLVLNSFELPPGTPAPRFRP
jgi:hypothetical protein